MQYSNFLLLKVSAYSKTDSAVFHISRNIVFKSTSNIRESYRMLSKI